MRYSAGSSAAAGRSVERASGDADLNVQEGRDAHRPGHRRVPRRPGQRPTARPGLTDDPDNVDGVADLAAGWGPVGEGGIVEQVDILGYHRLGVAKYRELGLRYPLADAAPASAEQLAAAAEHFSRRGLRVTTS